LTAPEATRVNPFALAMGFLRANPLLTAFLSLSIAFRILFQVVTQRIWEDALILDSVTRNAWLGQGLTHQTSESPIQSFSSVVWMLFSLIGNSVGQGVFLLKLISLLATVATLWFAYLIALRWKVNKPGIILILGFLSFEQIHVTFGMAGMESQFATAFVLMGIWAVVEQRPILLMLTTTTAPLVRPELIFWSLMVVVIYMLRPRLITVRAIAISVTPLILWLVFATFYYGTFIPQTVTAKSLIGTTNLSRGGITNGINASLNSWERISPYFSNYFATSGLIPRIIGIWIVAALVVLFIFGVFRISRVSLVWAVPALMVPIFVFYVGFFNISNYQMWYVPPFSAVLILYAGAAFNLLPKVAISLKYFLSCTIVVIYLLPALSYFQHEALVQSDIDEGVRQATGIELNKLLSGEQTVILEPLGFMGSEINSGAVVDYPGLASRIMTDSLRLLSASDRNMGSAVREIQPDFVVVRENEWQSFAPNEHPELKDYKLITTIGKPADGSLAFPGATYTNADRYFEIYGR
jgi:hypothetical protein